MRCSGQKCVEWAVYGGFGSDYGAWERWDFEVVLVACTAFVGVV